MQSVQTCSSWNVPGRRGCGGLLDAPSVWSGQEEHVVSQPHLGLSEFFFFIEKGAAADPVTRAWCSGPFACGAICRLFRHQMRSRFSASRIKFWTVLSLCPGPRPEPCGRAGSVSKQLPIRSRQLCSTCVRRPQSCHRAAVMGGRFCDCKEPGQVLCPGLSQQLGLPLTGERRCSFLLLSGPW